FRLEGGVGAAVVEPRLFLPQEFEAPVELLKHAALLGKLEPLLEPGQGGAGSLERRAMLGERDAEPVCCSPDLGLDFVDRRGWRERHCPAKLEGGRRARSPPDADQPRVPAERAARALLRSWVAPAVQRVLAGERAT